MCTQCSIGVIGSGKKIAIPAQVTHLPAGSTAHTDSNRGLCSLVAKMHLMQK